MDVDQPNVMLPPPPAASTPSPVARAGPDPVASGCLPTRAVLAPGAVLIVGLSLIAYGFLHHWSSVQADDTPTTAVSVPMRVRPAGLSRRCDAAFLEYGRASMSLVDELGPPQTATLQACASPREWLIGARFHLSNSLDPEAPTEAEELDAWCAAQTAPTRVCAAR